MNKITSLVAVLCLATLTAAGCMPSANAAPADGVTFEMLRESAATLNTGGDHVFASLTANAADAGTVVTIVDGGSSTQLYTVLAGTGMAAGEVDGSGCITTSATTGKFTVAKKCGAGTLRLVACIDDAIGVAGKTVRGSWHRTRSGTTTQIGPVIRKTENGPKADAGNVAAAYRTPMGCAAHDVAASLSDTYEFRFLSDTAADTVTVRGGTLSVLKLLGG